MPERSGIEALIDTRTRDPNAVVIICSTVASNQTIFQAIGAGAIDFLTKPISSSALVLAAYRALEMLPLKAERRHQVN